MTGRMKMTTRVRTETRLQKRKRIGTYKDGLVAMFEAKKLLAAECKEEKTSRWNELKMLDDKKCKSKLTVAERKLKVKERSLALKEEQLRNAKKAKD
ncbi:60S ribosomal protein L36a [Hordeum vulgare]|nr:60S ribosomal protein L36a [Hordeum vulgare]